MSGVVLRCPTCGTTQSHPGECDACQEGTVRYFCGNHTPGVWLSEPTCNVCGAKFGEKPIKPPEPTPSVTPPRPSGETRRPDPRPARETRRPAPRTPTPRRVSPPHIERGRKPSEVDPDETSAPPFLSDLLAEIVRERRAKLEEMPAWEPEVKSPRPRSVPFIGCLFKLAILLFLLLVIIIGGLYLLMTSGF